MCKAKILLLSFLALFVLHPAFASSGSSGVVPDIPLGTSAAGANPHVIGDASTGVFTSGTKHVDISINGVQIMDWASTGAQITGILGVSGNATFGGAVTMSGLSTTTQVSCIGLDSGNHLVLSSGACGSGSGSGTVTGPVSSSNLFVPQWNGTSGTVLGGGLPVGTSGNSTIVETDSGGHITAAIVPTLNQSTTGNAATATALASAPTQCGGGQFATGIAVSGNANCSTPAGGSQWTTSGSNISYATGAVAIGTTAQTSGTSLDLGSNNNAMLLPSGTSAQRPTGVAGMVRYNSTTAAAEAFFGGAWNSWGGSSVGSSTPNQLLQNQSGAVGGVSLIPVGLGGPNVAQRVPNNADDWTQGYNGDGSIDGIWMSNNVTGCSGTPTITFSAPTTGGITATAHFAMNAGAPYAAVLDTPGKGYLANPTLTISNTTGCSSAPTVLAYMTPNGQLWLDGNGAAYQAHQADANAATWSLVPVPKNLPLDSVANPISSAAAVAAGNGYNVSDTITIANGTVLTVATLTGGAGTGVATVTVSTPGAWGCKSNSTYPQVSTTGSGTGASFNVAVQTAVFAAGNRLLTQCYTTNKGADIVRASDSATLTVGFVNGALDTSSMQAFCAGTTCKYSKWYDQSGNGNDAVQATDANRPVIDFNRLWDGIPTVYGTNSAYLNIPSGAAYNYAGFSVYDLVSAESSNLNTFFNAGAVAENTGGHLLFQEPSGSNNFNVGRPSSFNPEIIGVSSTSSSSAVYSDNDYEYTCSSGCNNGAGAVTGGTIGVNSGVWNLWASQMFVIWPKALSATDRVAFRSSTYRTFKVTPQVRDIVITAGDSRAAAQGSTNGVGFQLQMQPLLKNKANIYNVGVPSQKLDVPPNSDIANCYTAGGGGDCLTSVNVPHGKNSWITLWTGYNDNANGVTPTTFLASLTNYVSIMHGLGMKIAVFVDPEATVYRTVIIGNSAGADLVIDLSLDPGFSGGWTSQTVQNFPHPFTFGYGLIASDVASAFNPVLK